MSKYNHLLVASLALWGACVFEHNPYYCKGAPLDNCTLIDAALPDVPTAPDAAAPDAFAGCTADQQCTLPMASVCDVSGSRTCVQCTQDDFASCTGSTPVCMSNTCQKCTEHAQCASGACLPGGACGDDTNVAYIDATGSDNPACSKAAPCLTVMNALSLGRPYMKFHGTTDEPISIKGGRVVTFLADAGATLTRRSSGNGAILTVQDNDTSLSVYDLSISNAPNDPSGIGCLVPTAGAKLALTRVTISNNPGGGISMSGGTVTVSQSTVSGNTGVGISMSGGTVTVSQSTVSGNTGVGVSTTGGTVTVSQSTIINNPVGISSTGGTATVSQSTIINNPVGGLSITGATAFNVNNTLIAYNGRALGQPTEIGGAVLTANTSGSRFEWNTVAFNESSGLVHRGGLSCNAPMVAAGGNLIYHNSEPDGTGGLTTSAATQKNPTDVAACQFGNSLAVPTDANNLGLKSPLVAPFDFHLTSASPATIVDAGGVCSGVDIDGDPRPRGAACDLGADEYSP